MGATNGTHVLVIVPRKHRVTFLGRKHTTTQNVLAAVDFDLRCTYVLAAWEGSAHDALILADALQRPDRLKVPQGTYTPNQHKILIIENTMLSSDTTYLVFIRKILLGRCWVCMQIRISSPIQKH